AGQEAGPAETPAADQILYVIGGEAEVRVGEERSVAGPGTLVTIPARTLHHVRSAERSRCSSSLCTRRRNTSLLEIQGGRREPAQLAAECVAGRPVRRLRDHVGDLVGISFQV